LIKSIRVLSPFGGVYFKVIVDALACCKTKYSLAQWLSYYFRQGLLIRMPVRVSQCGWLRFSSVCWMAKSLAMRGNVVRENIRQIK